MLYANLVFHWVCFLNVHDGHKIEKKKQKKNIFFNGMSCCARRYI